MIKKLQYLIIVSISIVLLQSFGDPSAKYPGGSPGGYAGAPPLNKNCKYCHSGQSSTVTGWITTNIPPSGYIPGSSYTITVTATGTGKKGFEVTPRSAAGVFLGSLTAGTGNKLADTLRSVTHTTAVNATSASWTFTWTAPQLGTGTVTFYGAFAVGLQTTKLCTLDVIENTTGLQEIYSTPLTVYPNPVNNKVTIQLSIPEDGALDISLYNLSGEKTATLSNERTARGKVSLSLDIPGNISPGIYFICIQGKKIRHLQKVIIDR
jgi:hypothetical protein